MLWKLVLWPLAFLFNHGHNDSEAEVEFMPTPYGSQTPDEVVSWVDPEEMNHTIPYYLQCSMPKCDDDGCYIDYSTTPCSSCKCPNSPPAQCPQLRCKAGCPLDNSHKPCPRCSCPEQGRQALQNPDLFQEDILGFDPYERNVIPNQQMRWTRKRVPYVIDRTLASSTALIQAAINDYHVNTCIRFVPRTTERNYIKLFAGQGCYSYVGMINRGEQPLSLGNGCLYKGTIVHQLGHAIGFFHEQNRSDRDLYLLIFWDNITKGMEPQFARLPPNQNLLLTPFDHDSIMLYGNYAFSKDRRSLTMVAKNGKRLLEPYDKAGLTASDIQRVRKMYNC